MKAFEQRHPFVLLCYYLSILSVAMFLSHPILQSEALLGGILFCATLRRGGNLRFCLPLFFLVALTNPLFSHNGVTPLFFVNGYPVTLEALLYGFSIAAMLVAVLLWCQCAGEIMNSDKFLYLFGKIIPKLSLVLSMALRFIPLFLRQMRRVSRAQKAMGLYSSDSFWDKVKSRMRVLTAMIAWSLENAMDSAASMKARGYGIKGRSHFSLFRFDVRDGILLGICAVLTGITIAGAAAGVIAFQYYPRIGEVNLSLPALGVYAAFGILAILPFILEVKEALIWKYYRSKI